MAYWFFVSYAREDSDPYLDTFYKDLRREVLLKKNIPERELSFFDTQAIPIGAAWKEDLKTALRTSRIMISLCSPTYISREYCGKEFQVFRERQDQHFRSQGLKTLPNVILPVLWSAPNKVFPEVIKEMQYTHKGFPDIYAKEGLRYMMKLSKHKDDYEQFITQLASRIVEAGEQHQMPDLDELRPLEEIENAFLKPAAPAPQSAWKSGAGGFKSVLFVFVAAKPKELTGIKRAIDCYGEEGGRQWAPYLPPITDAVGILAQEVAAKQKVFYNELPLDEKLMERLEQAEKNQEIVIIIIDPWTLRLSNYQNIVKPYDKRNFINCAVLIPWNEHDPETLQARKDLEKDLKNIFIFKTEYKLPVYYRDSILSIKDLKSKLSKTLAEIRLKLIQAGEPRRKAESERFVKEAAEKGIMIDIQPVVDSTSKSAL